MTNICPKKKLPSEPTELQSCIFFSGKRNVSISFVKLLRLLTTFKYIFNFSYIIQIDLLEITDQIFFLFDSYFKRSLQENSPWVC